MAEFALSDDFPQSTKDMLTECLNKGARIDASVVEQIIDTMHIEVEHLMIMLLPTAASYARAPVSQFNVGAVAQGMPSGSLYLGSNMEFPGEALSFSVHGEQSAMTNAWLHGETGLQSLAINAAPCGYCRQFLYDLSTATTVFQILLKANADPSDYSYKMNPLPYYLPDAFGPEDLKINARLMLPEDHGLSIESSDPIAQAALAAANASYSPYTNDFCGVAFQRSDGTIFAGRYAENAAYNPSMSPLESALAFFSMSSAPQVPYDIVGAALVEASAVVSQKSATEDVLASVAPNVNLAYYTAS